MAEHSCGRCGRVGAEEARFCPACGDPLVAGAGPPLIGHAQPYTTPMSRGTNGFAIASMVLGIVWVYWVGSVLALVFGYVALSQIRERDQGGRGMAIAGVTLGWVGVGFFALLLILVAAGAFAE